MNTQRRLVVLRAIIEDYVETREPVGSKTIASKHGFKVSPATVRNDMMVLEEAGYITQPHTSAGRIPTDKGYRLFVDKLSEVKPLSHAERTAIESFLERSVDLDDVVSRSAKLLAQLTGQVAVVQYPSLSKSTVQHLEIIRLSDTDGLIVIITEAGRVEQRTVSIQKMPDAHDVMTVRNIINAAVVGKKLSTISQTMTVVAQDFENKKLSDEAQLVCAVERIITGSLQHDEEERLIMSGTANLAGQGQVFDAGLRKVLEALEEHVVLLKLFDEMSQEFSQPDDNIAVRIGHETHQGDLSQVSVITSGYGTKDEKLAMIGSIGPTRMDYPNTMAVVRAVAHYLTRIISE